MNWPAITDMFIWTLVGIVIFYDVWVIITKGSSASISVRVVEMSKKYLLIPVVIGVLIGHFFFPLYSNCQ